MAVFNTIGNNWVSVENFVNSFTGYTLKACIEDIFKDKNSYIYCQAQNCAGNSCYSGGYELCINRGQFLNKLSDEPKADRRACLAMLLSYTISDERCSRTTTRAYNIGIGFFKWWKQNFDVSASWTYHDCPCI